MYCWWVVKIRNSLKILIWKSLRIFKIDEPWELDKKKEHWNYFWIYYKKILEIDFGKRLSTSLLDILRIEGHLFPLDQYHRWPEWNWKLVDSSFKTSEFRAVPKPIPWRQNSIYPDNCWKASTLIGNNKSKDFDVIDISITTKKHHLYDQYYEEQCT